jgi:hypothetical protein
VANLWLSQDDLVLVRTLQKGSGLPYSRHLQWTLGVKSVCPEGLGFYAVHLQRALLVVQQDVVLAPCEAGTLSTHGIVLECRTSAIMGHI